MTLQNIGLMQAMGAKMGYLNQRQGVIAQNVANANTPGYKPQDLQPVDFGRVLGRVSGESRVRLETTNAGHMPPPGTLADPKARNQRLTYEASPTGNAVILEEQMVKSAAVTTDYNLMTTLYQKNVDMLRMAVGRTQ